MSLRILLVDGSTPMRCLLRRFLEATGAATPLEAASAEEALALFKPEGFDVIILDLNLAEGDGMEVIRTVRQSDAQVAIIVLTTCADDAIRQQASEAGATEYLTKPFSVATRQKLLKYCHLVPA